MPCIFCKNPFNSENPKSSEHIIPKALGNKTTVECVCVNCNNALGRTIDSNFINSPLIDILRIFYRDFLPKQEIPKIRQDAIMINVDTQERTKGVFYGDCNGFQFTNEIKHKKHENGPSEFIIPDNVHGKKVIKQILKSNKFKKVQVEKIPTNIKIENVSINSGVYFIRELVKTFLSYLAFIFGENTVLEAIYDDLREYLFGRKLLHEDYKFRLVIQNCDLPKPTEKISHSLNINSSEFEGKSIFEMTLFSNIKFMILIPRLPYYKKSNEIAMTLNRANGSWDNVNVSLAENNCSAKNGEAVYSYTIRINTN